jgi:ribosomal protein L11 methylase PrmA
VERDPASFRDPAGHVYRDGPRILRTVSPKAAPHYEAVRDAGALRAWIDRGWVVETREVGAPDSDDPFVREAAYVLEHAPIPFVSYPYEWTFPLLQSAALLHLDLCLDALERGFQLSDATAFNMQFVGVRPVFIDVLSFRPYRAGDYWIGHRQFCEQFLNPLLASAAVGLAHNAWLRGSPEGITAAELNAALPFRRKLAWNVFSHVTLPARLARRAAANRSASASIARRGLPRSAFEGLLRQLRGWIARLKPRHVTPSIWAEYATMGTYSADERQRKLEMVRRFIGSAPPRMLWDLGCNTGEYSQAAAAAGAHYVVGFDADHGALHAAHERSARETLPCLPLYLDAANPSPDQGWGQRERRGLAARGPADAVLALALVHHLAIARNIPLDAIMTWITGIGRRGLVEFVPKADPAVQLMLSAREDVFDRYSQEAFEAALAGCARIAHAETISASGRRVYEFTPP